MFILIIKPTRCTNFSNLFWNETLHISDSSPVHHQEFFTVHTAMVYVIQVCWQLLASCQRTCMTYIIVVCTVKNSWWFETRRVFFLYFADCASQYIYLNINQLDALNFLMSLFSASTCFEHMCSSSEGQNCTIQPLVSSHL